MPIKANKIEEKNGKKTYSYKRFIIALSEKEHKLWKENFKEKGFDTMTAMIRYAVNLLFDEIPNPNQFKQTSNIDTSKIEKEILDFKKEYRKTKDELLNLNRQMLKCLTNVYQNGNTTKIATIQEKIVRLIDEKPRMLNELITILGVKETEVLSRLNELVKDKIIDFISDEMEWRRI